MTNEEMERAIEFLLNHHAQLSANLSRQAENLDKLTANVEAMHEEMREGFDKLTANVEAMREEMHYGFDKLILANEVTRRLTEEVAQLAVQTSQRVTGLEHRVSDLESKP